MSYYPRKIGLRGESWCNKKCLSSVNLLQVHTDSITEDDNAETSLEQKTDVHCSFFPLPANRVEGDPVESLTDHARIENAENLSLLSHSGDVYKPEQDSA